MSDEETTPVSETRNQAPAQAPSETASGSPVMLLVILGGLFVAVILFGAFVR
jgi:hypothetical protein